jgi:predicted nucleic acid-binding Zn ribbon protein
VLSLLYGLSYHGPDCTAAPFKLWVRLEVGYYSFNVLFCYLYYKHIKRNRRESFKMMVFNCMLNVLHTGWLTYGNVIWYNKQQVCNEEFANWDKFNDQSTKSAEALIWMMLALIIVGYLPMLKCCSISTLVLCFGPSLWRSLSRQQRSDANWVPTTTNIL